MIRVARTYPGAPSSLSAILCAQSNTTAELRGVVTDPSTAAVPRAKLTITGEDIHSGYFE
jgi:hypothetical protein